MCVWGPQESRDLLPAFFSLSDHNWQGFLSARLSLLGLIGFGFTVFVNAENSARLNLLRMGGPALLAMLVELVRIGF